MMEKDHMFDQILEEDEELEEIIDDDGCDEIDDEDILAIGGCNQNLRRPSAKLPPNYHSNITEYNIVPGMYSLLNLTFAKCNSSCLFFAIDPKAMGHYGTLGLQCQCLSACRHRARILHRAHPDF